jgi:mono/diheme cytochrome c family protein
MKLMGVIKVLAVLVVLFVLIQLIPYGRSHLNPAAATEPKWDGPQTRVLVQRACFDCHSSETIWPWYSNLAPISWLIQHDVEQGRSVMNFTDWAATTSSGRIRNRSTTEITNVILRNSMPPFYYTIMHPDAVLSTIEKEQLIQGLNKTLANQ